MRGILFLHIWLLDMDAKRPVIAGFEQNDYGKHVVRHVL